MTTKITVVSFQKYVVIRNKTVGNDKAFHRISLIAD